MTPRRSGGVSARIPRSIAFSPVAALNCGNVCTTGRASQEGNRWFLRCAAICASGSASGPEHPVVLDDDPAGVAVEPGQESDEVDIARPELAEHAVPPRGRPVRRLPEDAEVGVLDVDVVDSIPPVAVGRDWVDTGRQQMPGVEEERDVDAVEQRLDLLPGLDAGAHVVMERWLVAARSRVLDRPGDVVEVERRLGVAVVGEDRPGGGRDGVEDGERRVEVAEARAERDADVRPGELQPVRRDPLRLEVAERPELDAVAAGGGDLREHPLRRRHARGSLPPPRLQAPKLTGALPIRWAKVAPAYLVRSRIVQSMAQFDVVVIGGGIVGAGTAALAAQLGLRVALLERDDFAAGTSSASSKLVHGGLRYLRMGDVALVREALHESRMLRRRIAPHLVQDLQFVLPVYDDGPYGRLSIGAAMAAYGAFALRRPSLVSPDACSGARATAARRGAARRRRLLGRADERRAAHARERPRSRGCRCVRRESLRGRRHRARRRAHRGRARAARRGTSSTRPARPSTRCGGSRIRRPARR